MQKELLRAYFKENSLVTQQIRSYDDFIANRMQRIIDRIGSVQTNVEGFEMKLGKVRIDYPRYYEVKGGYSTLTPNEARLRNLTYAAPVFLEVVPIFNGVERPVYSDVFIGEIPVMVKSSICYLSKLNASELIEKGEDPNDPGGYFIINGSERVLVSVEDLVPNKMLTTIERTGVVAKVFSTRHGFRARCVVTRGKEGLFSVEFPSAPPGIPLIQLLRVLAFEKDSQIIKAFSEKIKVQNDVLLNIDAETTKNREEAVEFLSKKLSPGQPTEFRINRMENLLDNYLLPHISVSSEKRLEKAQYLIRMAERSISVAYKQAQPDDKDHYANKRIKLAGNLMEELFRYAFQFLIKDLVYQTSRADARGRRLQVHTLVRQDAFADRIRYAMATGNWIGGHTGVSQLLDRISYLATLSHLRRAISPLSKKHPHFKARDLHGTHWGKLCPNETPEGPSCSLVKNFSIYANATIDSSEDEVLGILRNFGVKE